MEERLRHLINEINSNLIENYSSIKDIFNNEYGWPELDPVRDEICKCIMFGLSQAAITLTNHLLESSLKKCLIYKYTIDNKKDIDEKKIETIFKNGIDKFDNSKSDLSKSINAACTNGLITKKQKMILHDFRERFRNSFSHASSQKTFGDMKIPAKIINSIDQVDKQINNEISVKDVPIIQGIVQSIISSKLCIPYFREVDEIIREMFLKLDIKR